MLQLPCVTSAMLGSSEHVREQVVEDCTAAPTGVADTWLGFVVHGVEYEVLTVADGVVAGGLTVSPTEALLRA